MTKTTKPIAHGQVQDLLDKLEQEQGQARQDAMSQPGPTHNMEYDMLRSDHMVNRVRASDSYAQNLYAAMCNTVWQEHDVWEILSDQTWSCSWRYAGEIVSRMRGQGDYMDWYCSGIQNSDQLAKKDFVTESHITQEILQDLGDLGWAPAPTNNSQ
jgi:hypothetical protein